MIRPRIGESSGFGGITCEQPGLRKRLLDPNDRKKEERTREAADA